MRNIINVFIVVSDALTLGRKVGDERLGFLLNRAPYQMEMLELGTVLLT